MAESPRSQFSGLRICMLQLRKRKDPACLNWASVVAQTVKNLPTMEETQVRSLCQGIPLEKGMATHSSILAWRIPWTEEPGGLQSMGVAKSGTRLSD